MKYTPNSPAVVEDMLRSAGFSSLDELFKDIPEAIKLKRQLNLGRGCGEIELSRELKGLAAKNLTTEDYPCFLGAGAYDHYIPAAIDQLLLRSEFYTAYTPYQAEISQGILQSIFEYQSMICLLTGMEVANASMYDGATALAEAATMACGVKKRRKILVPETVNPQSREVVSTYARFRGNEVINTGSADGQADLSELEQRVTGETAVILIQSPNFFGCMEDVAAIAELAHQKGALLVVSCDPVSLALLKDPGELGADVAVGEGQSLGNPLEFGGPYLGFFAAKKELMRKMPGRIVGRTVDQNGRTGFVLTLQAREQHIRREKATSNICSNEALNALAATIYLSLLGKQGLREVALQCARKSHYACDRLLQSGAFEPAFRAPYFQEFTVKYRGSVEKLNAALLKEKIIGGFDAAQCYDKLHGHWIVAVTEKRTRQEIDTLVAKAVTCSD